MTLMELAKQGVTDVGMVNIPFLTERLTVSMCCHFLNLSNLDKPRFYHMGSLERIRNHQVIVAPSGYGKSVYINFFLNPKWGLLSGMNNLPTSVRSTISPHGWIGTVTGDGTKTKGIFGRFKRGIIGADEYTVLGEISERETSGKSSNEETYMLTGLDSETVNKDLAQAPIEEDDIGTTFWAGSRIRTMDGSSGIIRRFSIHLFFPTLSIAKQFKAAGRSKDCKRRISVDTLANVTTEISRLGELIDQVDEVNFNEIESFLNGSLAVTHFTEKIYKRMAMGYSLATGTFPEIIIDEPLKELFRNEEWGRRIISNFPEREAMYQVVLNEKTLMTKAELSRFFEVYYQLPQGRIKSAWLANIPHRLFIKATEMPDGKYKKIVYAREEESIDGYSMH